MTSSANCDAATRFIGLRRFHELLPTLLHSDGSLGVAVQIKITPDLIPRKRKAGDDTSAQQQGSELPSSDAENDGGTSNRLSKASPRPQGRMIILPCESIVAVRNEGSGWWLAKLNRPVFETTAVVEVRWFEQAGKRWR